MIYFAVMRVVRDALLSILYIAFALIIFLFKYLIGFQCGNLFVLLIALVANFK